MALRIVLLGPPGAGKGTQAVRLCQSHTLAHVATGNILRDHVRRETDLGKEIGRALGRGKMVTDELACSIVFTRLAEYDCHLWGYVLDGFPRSVPQAQRLDVWLAEGHERLCAVVYLDASDEEIVKRTVARRQCEECETIYNLEFDPPPDPTRCSHPDCPGRLVQRDDDTEETIRERLRIFHKTTQPLLSYYEEQDLLQRVPGCGMTPDTVQKKIEEALATLGAV